MMMLQFPCRFDMLGELHGTVAIGGEASEELGQHSELLAREHPEQRVIDRAMKGGEPCQSADTLIGDGQLNSAAVARMGALLSETIRRPRSRSDAQLQYRSAAGRLLTVELISARREDRDQLRNRRIHHEDRIDCKKTLRDWCQP